MLLQRRHRLVTEALVDVGIADQALGEGPVHVIEEALGSGVHLKGVSHGGSVAQVVAGDHLHYVGSRIEQEHVEHLPVSGRSTVKGGRLRRHPRPQRTIGDGPVDAAEVVGVEDRPISRRGDGDLRRGGVQHEAVLPRGHRLHGMARIAGSRLHDPHPVAGSSRYVEGASIGDRLPCPWGGALHVDPVLDLESAVEEHGVAARNGDRVVAAKVDGAVTCRVRVAPGDCRVHHGRVGVARVGRRIVSQVGEVVSRVFPVGEERAERGPQQARFPDGEIAAAAMLHPHRAGGEHRPPVGSPGVVGVDRPQPRVAARKSVHHDVGWSGPVAVGLHQCRVSYQPERHQFVTEQPVELGAIEQERLVDGDAVLGYGEVVGVVHRGVAQPRAGHDRPVGQLHIAGDMVGGA